MPEGTLSRGCLKTSHPHSSGIELWPRFQIEECWGCCLCFLGMQVRGNSSRRWRDEFTELGGGLIIYISFVVGRVSDAAFFCGLVLCGHLTISRIVGMFGVRIRHLA